tara:strand:+ start:209 stop:607 length:399 start_codon:yes stop_codon:yes gene_type:complete
MAKFLKFETLAAARPEVLINIEQIGGILVANDNAGAGAAVTTATITMQSGTPGVYTVSLAASVTGTTQAAREAELQNAINSALTANPGGVVSTVVPPLTTAQAPVAQSGLQGRQPITAQAVYNQFTDCTFVA